MTLPDARLAAMRPAVAADLDALVEIDVGCFPAGIAYSREEIAWMLRDPKARPLGAPRC